MDYFLLAAGLVRIAIWLLGAYIALRAHRPRGVVGFLLAALTGIVFTLAIAHGHVPLWVLKASSYCATPGTALIVVSYAIQDRDRKEAQREIVNVTNAAAAQEESE
jgi:hypothetical protein